MKEYGEQDFQKIPAVEVGNGTGDVRPLVSVLMITWNHEGHVAEAIESVLNQQCAFPFEIIIGEDCSQDRTRDICDAFQRRFPTAIRLVVADENVGMHRNLSRIWCRARGKYIAFCEGDDYWTDSKKLMKQTEWMEARPTFTLCGTYTQTILQDKDGCWRNGGIIGPPAVKEEYTIEDLIPNYTFHFSSVMVRKDVVQFPRWFWKVYCADRPLYLLCAEKGPAGLISDVTSVYRMHEGGVWAPIDQLEKARKGIHLFDAVNAHFDHRYNDLIRRTLGHIIWFYMSEVLQCGDRFSAKTLFWQSMRYQFPRIGYRKLSTILSVMFQLYLPALYREIKSLKTNRLRS